MARPRLTLLNITYSLVGLAVAGAIGYSVYRVLKGRGAEREAEVDRLMGLRRSTRKAGRAVKDTATQVGKTVKRGAEDVGQAIEDAPNA